MNGWKDDHGKPRLDLVEPGWLWEIGHVLSHGATKYSPGDWQNIAPERFRAAAMRHFLAYMTGETTAPDTGLHHMAHLACNAMFLYWLDRGAGLPTQACQCSLCTPPVVGARIK